MITLNFNFAEKKSLDYLIQPYQLKTYHDHELTLTTQVELMVLNLPVLAVLLGDKGFQN
jgi:hypothetical protein